MPAQGQAAATKSLTVTAASGCRGGSPCAVEISPPGWTLPAEDTHRLGLADAASRDEILPLPGVDRAMDAP